MESIVTSTDGHFPHCDIQICKDNVSVTPVENKMVGGSVKAFSSMVVGNQWKVIILLNKVKEKSMIKKQKWKPGSNNA